MAIDVGMVPMEEEGWGAVAIDSIRHRLTLELRRAFDGQTAVSRRSGRRLAVTVDPNPILHGYWGEDTVATMSHQTVCLGTPALQLELPYSVRELLMRDGALFDRFATAIFSTFEEAVARDGCGGKPAAPTAAWARMGSATAPLKELVVSPIGTRELATMLADLKRADESKVHGKSI